MAVVQKMRGVVMLCALKEINDFSVYYYVSGVSFGAGSLSGMLNIAK